MTEGFGPGVVRAQAFTARLLSPGSVDEGVFPSSLSSEEEAHEAEDADDSLNETAETERDYVRGRLRDELGREPSEEEVDEWLRRHTEGY